MSQKFLIIDAYNVLHSWQKYGYLPQIDRPLLCRQLIGALYPLVDTARYHLIIVFDGKEAKITFDREYDSTHLEVIWAPSHLSADSVIEQIVQRHPNPQTCEVVTLDRAIINTFHSVGAFAITPAELKHRILSLHHTIHQGFKTASNQKINDPFSDLNLKSQ